VIDLQNAIANEDLMVLKNIKGIGAKTAQRIVVDLKDKVKKLGVISDEPSIVTTSSPVRSESISALVMLGFLQSASAKVVDKVLKENPSFSVEQTIKMALKLL
jgi:Holliday junction DNA helicase RuvA